MYTQTLPERSRIAIVGGGAAGTLTAANLLAGGGAGVTLIERTGRFGPGVAYGTADPAHLLNVRAGAMSAYPDRPGDFVSWLSGHEELVSPADFVPRGLFGVYLRDVLAAAESGSRGRATLHRVHGAAMRLVPERAGRGLAVHLADGRRLAADACVLALGPFRPRDPAVPGLASCDRQRYVRDPWGPRAIERVGRDGAILLVGTGLTAVDVALTLLRRGHRGVVHAVSRRGLLPRTHSALPLEPAPERPLPPGPLSVRGLVSWVRAEVAEAARQGRDWRAVVDSLRPHTVALWQALPHAERRRFLRHSFRLWEVHRHRMAPRAAELISSMRRRGQLQVHAGRLVEVRPRSSGAEVRLRMRGDPDAVRLGVSAIVNCTGPGFDPAQADEPLVDDLLRSGLARRDPLGLGLQVSETGALVGDGGKASEVLFAIGALRRGALWETTAIPEIRAQAAALSAHLAPLPQPLWR